MAALLLAEKPALCRHSDISRFDARSRGLLQQHDGPLNEPPTLDHRWKLVSQPYRLHQGSVRDGEMSGPRASRFDCGVEGIAIHGDDCCRTESYLSTCAARCANRAD